MTKNHTTHCALVSLLVLMGCGPEVETSVTSTTTPTTTTSTTTQSTTTVTTTETATVTTTETGQTSVTQTDTTDVLPKPEDPFCGKRIVGFYPVWAYHRLPLDEVQYENLTDIIFAFLEADAAGNITGTHGGEFGVLKPLVKMAHAHDVRVQASILSDFSALVDNADGSRDAFITSLVNLMVEHDLDGVDFDWEGGAFSEADRLNYAALLTEFSAHPGAEGKHISLDTVTWRNELNSDALPNVQWMNGMGYDSGPPDHTSVDDGITVATHWTSMGLMPPRMLMGTGFYGLMADWSALEFLYIMDSWAPAPSVNQTNGYGFCNNDCVAEKMRWVVENGYGGMMIWELSQDVMGERSLLKTMGDTLREVCAESSTVVHKQDEWAYFDGSNTPGNLWKIPNYDDDAWATGTAPLGYMDNHILTSISYGPDKESKNPTAYFRNDFEVTSKEGIEELILGLMRDDGAVVYLNGTELYRTDNMPKGAIAYETLATTTMSAYDEVTYLEVRLPANLLVKGTNTLAVEVHQGAINSADMSFDLYLRVVNP